MLLGRKVPWDWKHINMTKPPSMGPSGIININIFRAFYQAKIDTRSFLLRDSTHTSILIRSIGIFLEGRLRGLAWNPALVTFSHGAWISFLVYIFFNPNFFRVHLLKSILLYTPILRSALSSTVNRVQILDKVMFTFTLITFFLKLWVNIKAGSYLVRQPV